MIRAPSGIIGIVIRGAQGSEIRSLTLTGGLVGVSANAAQVLVRDAHFHDQVIGVLASAYGGAGHVELRNALFEDHGETAVVAHGGVLDADGVHVKRSNRSAGIGGYEAIGAPAGQVPGPGRLNIRRALVEATREVGIGCYGCIGEVRESVVRDTLPGAFGPGVGIVAGPVVDEFGDNAQLTVDSVHVVRARAAGITASGAILEVRNVTIEDVQPDTVTHAGHGIHLGGEPRDMLALIAHTTVERAIGNGVFAAGAIARLDGVLVRDTMPFVSGDDAGELGVGIQMRTTELWSDVRIFGCNVEHSRRAGVLGVDGLVRIDGSRVDGTGADNSGLGGGVVMTSTGERPIDVAISDSLVSDSVGVGVLIAGGEGSLFGSAIRGTKSAGLVGSSSGVMVQHHQGALASTVTLDRLLVRDSVDVGISVFGSSATLRGCVVDATDPAVDDRFGDGVMLSSDALPASVDLDGVLVRGSARAGLASFGGSARYTRSALECQLFDVDGETAALGDFDFDDAGGNACGCPRAHSQCRVVTAALEPPALIALE